MTSARIALAGILVLLAGVAGMVVIESQSKYKVYAPRTQPSISNAQLANDQAEFAGVIAFDDKWACPRIVGRLQAIQFGDRFFPLAYGLCLLAVALFVGSPVAPGLPAQPRAARIFAWITAAAVIATVIADYRENSYTDPLLVNACTALPTPAALFTMRHASFDKWAWLGSTMVFLALASLTAARTGAWYFTFTAIRALAALLGGLSGILAWAIEEPRLVQFELLGLTAAILATLWQVADAFRRRGS